MKRLLFLACISASFITSQGVFAQQFNNAALAAKATVFTQEVEGNCTQYTTSQHISANAQLLSRVEIKSQPYVANEGYQLMSNLALKNKCVSNLQRDEVNFDPNNFNPLKYFMNFTPGVSTTYRVDNTSYIIVIHN